MSVDLTNPNNLANVLAMLSANDTETVKQGEALLKPFMKKSACIIHIVQQLQHSPVVTHRAHAALLLKKKVGAFYPKFNAQQQRDLKAELLKLMATEPEKVVATAIAGCVAILAKAALARGGEWPEMFQMLLTFAHDPNERLRALNYNLIGQLAESVPSHLKPHTKTLADMFSLGCQDAVPAVVVASLEATAAYIQSVGSSEEIMHLKGTITPMLFAMDKCLKGGEEEAVIEGLDVIQECCTLEQPLVNDFIEMIVQFVVTILKSSEYEAAIKQSAGQTLMNIIEYRPKLFAKKNLVPPTLTMLMEMIAAQESSAAGTLFAREEEEGRGGDDDDDEESYDSDLDVQRLSQMLIDVMAIHIPSKYFVDSALTLCGQGIGSADPHMRKAGCAVLGVIAEGCCDRIRETMGEILPRVLASVQDPEYFVRECACFALGQFSEYCQPDILHYNQMVIPVIIQALDDPRSTVQRSSCYVLEVFCENLQKETLRPYLNQLMTKLIVPLASYTQLLNSPATVAPTAADGAAGENTPGNKQAMLDRVLSTIAAVALAAEIDFLPYTESVCEILGQLINDSDPKHFTVRGRALECLGHIAVALGPEHFSRYFEHGMQAAIQGAHFDDESLKEQCFVFIANCAKVMGNAFDSYLPNMLPCMFDVVLESELVRYASDDEDDEEDEAGPVVAANTGGSAEGGEEEEQEFKDFRLNIQEGFINTKKSALTAIGSLARYTKASFYPYMEQALNTIMAVPTGAMHSLHYTIRTEAYEVMQYLVMSACAANGITLPPKLGEVLTLPPNVMELTRVVLDAYVSCMLEDEEKYPVGKACEGVIGVLSVVGLAGLHLPTIPTEGKPSVPMATRLMEAILLILKEKCPAQLIAKRERAHAADDDEDDDDHDQIVMDAVTDVVGVLAKVLGPHFVQYFDEFVKPLLKFTKPMRSHSDRSMAIGCFAEVFAEIGPACGKYAPAVLPIIHTGLSDTMEGVRRNSAFCIGVLVESIGPDIGSEQILNLLQWLHPLCTRQQQLSGSDTGGADIDNALAAVARMIKTCQNLVPLSAVLPVLLAALPLRSDTSEGPVIYQSLATLLLTLEPTAWSMLPQILMIYAECLSPTATSVDETKSIVVTNIKELMTSPQTQGPFSTGLQQMTDEGAKQILQQVLSS